MLTREGSPAPAVTTRSWHPTSPPTARSRMPERDKVHNLYRAYDVEDNLLYIGISSSAAARFCSHATSSKWWCLVRKIELEVFESRQATEEAEKIAIESEQPLYNKQYQRSWEAEMRLHTEAWRENERRDYAARRKYENMMHEAYVENMEHDLAPFLDDAAKAREAGMKLTRSHAINRFAPGKDCILTAVIHYPDGKQKRRKVRTDLSCVRGTIEDILLALAWREFQSV